jgi:hypothetical protein
MRPDVYLRKRESPPPPPNEFILLIPLKQTASVVLWSEFVATDPEVPDSIPGYNRFSEK